MTEARRTVVYRSLESGGVDFRPSGRKDLASTWMVSCNKEFRLQKNKALRRKNDFFGTRTFFMLNSCSKTFFNESCLETIVDEVRL